MNLHMSNFIANVKHLLNWCDVQKDLHADM